MIRYCAQQAVVHGIERDWKYAISDVEALPLPDASFDLVISAGVIEYLPGDGPFLRELSRVLRPGGRLLLCVTNRYGYSEIFHSLLYRIKKIPGVSGAASSLRRLVAGGQHGVMSLQLRSPEASPPRDGADPRSPWARVRSGPIRPLHHAAFASVDACGES
jgi:SAM-dependent methyltransferase